MIEPWALSVASGPGASAAADVDGSITVGIDIGGTKIAAACRRMGRLEETVLEGTARNSADAVLDQVVRLVELVAGSVDAVDAVGVSVAGEVAYSDGVVLNASNLPLSGIPLRRVLAERLRCPVIIENDGNCAAIAEAHAGGWGTIRDVVVLTLGTGVGGGVIAGGHLLRGGSGRGTELGHLVVDANGPPCFGSCPSRGCLEALCSGTALARDGRLIAMIATPSRLAQILRQTGTIRAEDVVDSARDGDRRAKRLMDGFGRCLGVGLASLINIFDPTDLAIGGGLSAASDLFLKTAVDEVMKRIAPAQQELVNIRLARLGRSASVAGAAILALQNVGGGNRSTAASNMAP